AKIVAYDHCEGYRGSIYAGMPKIPSQINVKLDVPGFASHGGAGFMYLWEPGVPREATPRNSSCASKHTPAHPQNFLRPHCPFTPLTLPLQSHDSRKHNPSRVSAARPDRGPV